ncbi:hypothetical protein L0F63_002210 [Massospora cicadina]|nr:hypothetical protein L0F63_002210 [Massospora cicadina]
MANLCLSSNRTNHIVQHNLKRRGAAIMIVPSDANQNGNPQAECPIVHMRKKRKIQILFPYNRLVYHLVKVASSHQRFDVGDRIIELRGLAFKNQGS